MSHSHLVRTSQGRCLKQCLSEHRRALRNGDTRASSQAEHVFTTGHAVELTLCKVLDHHQHTTTRCMLESWHIQRSQTVLNRERGTLPEVYTALLDWLTDGHVTYIHWYFGSICLLALHWFFVSLVNSLTSTLVYCNILLLSGEREQTKRGQWSCSIRDFAMYIWYLTQVTYVFMRNCRVDFPQNTTWYNADYQ